jgi:hypothetical protein
MTTQQQYLLQPLLWLRLLMLTSVCRAASSAVYGPPSPLLVNAFVGGNESWFRFPEARSGSNYSMPSVTSRPRFGIALSGGGMRAATAGLGFLRGLHAVSGVPSNMSGLQLRCICLHRVLAGEPMLCQCCANVVLTGLSVMQMGQVQPGGRMAIKQHLHLQACWQCYQPGHCAAVCLTRCHVGACVQLGVTDGARYLTSNSGGSWLNAAFSFQQKVRGSSEPGPLLSCCMCLHEVRDALQ